MASSAPMAALPASRAQLQLGHGPTRVSGSCLDHYDDRSLGQPDGNEFSGHLRGQPAGVSSFDEWNSAANGLYLLRRCRISTGMECSCAICASTYRSFRLSPCLLLMRQGRLNAGSLISNGQEKSRGLLPVRVYLRPTFKKEDEALCRGHPRTPRSASHSFFKGGSVVRRTDSNSCLC
jgi:hypothetical protein